MAGLIQVGETVKYGEGVSGTVIKNKRYIIENDYPNSVIRLPHLAQHLKSVIAVPIMLGDDPIGVLAVTDSRKSFSEDDVIPLDRLSRLAALAIHTVRFFQLERQLAEISSAIDDTLELDAFAERVLGLIGQFVEYRYAAVYQILAGIPRLITNSSANIFGTELIEKITKMIINQRKILLSQRDFDVSDSEYSHSHKSMIVIPIIYNEDVNGQIILEHDQLDHYSSAPQDILLMFANQIAIVLDRSIRYQEEQYRRNNAHIVSRIIQNLWESLRSDQLLRSLVFQISEELNSDHCTFFVPQVNQDAHGDETIILKPAASSGKINLPDLGRNFSKDEGIVGRVYRTGISELLSDATSDEDFAPASTRVGKPRSMIVVPVRIGHRTIGIISVDRDEQSFYERQHLNLLNDIARQVGVVIERATMLEALQTTFRRIIRQQDVDGTLYQIVKGAVMLTKTTLGVIYLIRRSEETNEFELLKEPVKFPKDSKQPTKPRLLDPESVTRRIIDSQEITRIVPITKDDYVNPLLHEYNIQRMIGVPIILNREVIGVFYLRDTSKYDFTETEIYSLGILADVAAVAIHNADLLTEVRNQSELRKAILGIGNSMTKLDSLDETLVTIANQAWLLASNRDQNALLAHITLIDKEKLAFKAAWPRKYLKNLSATIGQIDLNLGSSIHKGKFGVVGRTVLEEQTIIIGNVVDDDEYLADYIQVEEDIRSILSVPIKDQSRRVIGVLVVTHSNVNYFTQEDKENMELLATQAAISIDKINLLIENKRHLDQLFQLFEASNKLGSSHNPDQILSDLIQWTLDVEGAMWVQIILVNDKHLPTSLVTHGKFKSHSLEDVRWNSNGISLEVYESRRAFIIEDVEKMESETEGRINSIMTRENVKASICLPFVSRDIPIGVVWIHYDTLREFSDKQIKILQIYVNLAATAYDNAKLRTNLQLLLK